MCYYILEIKKNSNLNYLIKSGGGNRPDDTQQPCLNKGAKSYRILF